MASLCKRGSLLIWQDKEMTWLAPHDVSPSRPAVFPDAAIQFCLTIKVLGDGERQGADGPWLPFESLLLTSRFRTICKEFRLYHE